MLYSITASHYDCESKGVLLYYTIESLIKCGIDKCFLSISFNGLESYSQYKNEIINLKKKFYENLKIFIHHEKMYQFQHLEYVCNKFSTFVKPDDKLIFCDDDDIMIELPPVNEHNVISGYQYLSDIVEDDETNFFDYGKIIDMVKTNRVIYFKKICDFSGYVCTYKLFKEFFEQNKFNYHDISSLNVMSLQLIDCAFMKYLDKFEPFEPTTPFIYHRIWSVKDRPIQEWRKNMLVNNTSIKNIYEKHNIVNIKKNHIEELTNKIYNSKKNKLHILCAIVVSCVIFAKYKLKIF